MRMSPGSLRKKIIYGYSAGAVLVLGFVLFSWGNLKNLEEMIKSGEMVSDLFDTTLEIRRFEKNYFLYETQGDYAELISYVERAADLVGRPELELFASPEVIDELAGTISAYSGLLVYGARIADRSQKHEWERDLRAKGHLIVTIAKDVSRTRKDVKRDALVHAQRLLFAGVAILVVSGIVAWTIFYRKAIMPLKVIEKHMNRISDGEFSLIANQFDDSELLSLKVAFNKMLLELQARQSHLVQSEKLASMGTLVFGVAHELNNPLSNIYTSAQILNEELEDGERENNRELLEQILSETERARDVVGSVLDYSRSKEKRTFNLKRAVNETVRLMKVEMPAAVQVSESVPDDIEIFADKQKIQQVILNLVSNALDAIEEEGSISISAYLEDSFVKLIIQDNGKGMDKDTLTKIFDPFYSSKRTRTGYGLGLFIVHNIINEHGGGISVDSSPSVGTVFTITLPVREA